MGNSVTEIDASTGALVQVISGSTYQFLGPGGLAINGSDLFGSNFSVDRSPRSTPRPVPWCR